MTEDQAREKWCPFVRITSVYTDGEIERISPAYNRLVDSEGCEVDPVYASRCIASRCMAWRTLKHGVETHTAVEACIPYGFCGLAGKP